MGFCISNIDERNGGVGEEEEEEEEDRSFKICRWMRRKEGMCVVRGTRSHTLCCPLLFLWLCALQIPWHSLVLRTSRWNPTIVAAATALYSSDFYSQYSSSLPVFFCLSVHPKWLWLAADSALESSARFRVPICPRASR